MYGLKTLLLAGAALAPVAVSSPVFARNEVSVLESAESNYNASSTEIQSWIQSHWAIAEKRFEDEAMACLANVLRLPISFLGFDGDEWEMCPGLPEPRDILTFSELAEACKDHEVVRPADCDTASLFNVLEWFALVGGDSRVHRAHLEELRVGSLMTAYTVVRFERACAVPT